MGRHAASCVLAWPGLKWLPSALGESCPWCGWEWSGRWGLGGATLTRLPV